MKRGTFESGGDTVCIYQCAANCFVAMPSDGRIKKVWPPISPTDHADELLAAL